MVRNNLDLILSFFEALIIVLFVLVTVVGLNYLFSDVSNQVVFDLEKVDCRYRYQIIINDGCINRPYNTNNVDIRNNKLYLKNKEVEEEYTIVFMECKKGNINNAKAR